MHAVNKRWACLIPFLLFPTLITTLFLYSCEDFYFQKSNHVSVHSTLWNNDANHVYFFSGFGLQSISLKWLLLQVSPNELNLWKQNDCAPSLSPISKSLFACPLFLESSLVSSLLNVTGQGDGKRRKRPRPQAQTFLLPPFTAFRPGLRREAVSYTHLTLPTTRTSCRSRWSPYH